MNFFKRNLPNITFLIVALGVLMSILVGLTTLSVIKTRVEQARKDTITNHRDIIELREYLKCILIIPPEQRINDVELGCRKSAREFDETLVPRPSRKSNGSLPTIVQQNQVQEQVTPTPTPVDVARELPTVVKNTLDFVKSIF